MQHFIFWLVAVMSIGRFLMIGWVISKHGEEKPTTKYNAFVNIIDTAIYTTIAYYLYLGL